ncbi:MAG: hypothetical protein IJG16_05930 [Clostridia bacterium]|nr:hypothetical protein [Clostridia bacterium]
MLSDIFLNASSAIEDTAPPRIFIAAGVLKSRINSKSARSNIPSGSNPIRCIIIYAIDASATVVNSWSRLTLSRPRKKLSRATNSNSCK